RSLDVDHPQILLAQNNLATNYQAQGKVVEAEALFRDTLEAARRVHGHDHPRTLMYQHNLGALYVAEDKLALAEPLLLDALERLSRVPGTHQGPLANQLRKNLA